MTKYAYVTPEVESGLVLCGSILIGSKTDVEVEINQVEVDDFNPGFSEGEDNVDFKELNFD